MLKRKLTKVIIALTLLFSAVAFAPATSSAISSVSCHTANIFYEARGESKEGMKAIAAVVINRTTSGKYPKDACMVIFQKNQFSWTKQQKFKDIQKVLNGDLSGFSDKDKQAFMNARLIASEAHTERFKVLPAGALWYHSSSSNPIWRTSMKRVKKIGQHIFYVKL